MNKQDELIEVFEDTQKFYSQDSAALVTATAGSRKRTKLYEADDYPKLPVWGNPVVLWNIADDPYGSISAQAAAAQAIQEIESGAPFGARSYRQELRITKHRTFEAAMSLHQEFPDKKIAVLNFASAMRPGGGVKHGSSAQEECLCRCSNLFPTIDRQWLWQKYYEVNRNAQDVRHTDACIYSPDIVICKTDEAIPKRLKEEEFVFVDVISCAAPNLSQNPYNKHNPETGQAKFVSEQELFEIHVKRAQHIMHVAAANHVDILVLGAFGCGAFANDPKIVAKAYHSALANYRSRFDVIEFAIYCSPGHEENFDAFSKELAIM